MTTYAAYNEGLPCKNPHCKSHGKPHPNCKCYGNMAEGGEVGHYCDKLEMHHKGCEYFAEGGFVNSEPQGDDALISALSYLAHEGLHGILKLHSDQDPDRTVKRYNYGINKGRNHFEKKIDALFAGEPFEKMDHSKARDSVHEWLEKGHLENDLSDHIHSHSQNYADGGRVTGLKSKLHNDHFAEAFPMQNILLQAAKGRMTDYLNTLRPQKNQPKLAFDDEPDTKKQQKSYKRALDIAVNPWHVLHKLKDGTLESEHVEHFRNLHPELNEHVQTKLTKKIIEAQMKKKKPPFRVRQGLSLLMGVPLSAEFMPQNIQAAQAVFANKQVQQQQPPPKTKMSSLTKTDDSYLTSDQARASRKQKGK